MRSRGTAICLAAGAGHRFGGGKLLAHFDGRPILQHVLDALAAAGIPDPVVVLGVHGDALEGGLDWRDADRIRNPDPRRGLASSLQAGWEAAMARNPHPGRVLVVLGDQPRIAPATIAALLAEPDDPARPVVVARHPDGSRNPVRLEPAAASLVAMAAGDRGLGPILDVHPELVRTIDVAAPNPDVDRRADLVRLVEDRWAERVGENAAQVERVREAPDGRDFYATVSRTFVADPARAGDPVLAALEGIAQPGDTWLDIGAGAGRYALPLARRVREVIAIDPSASMLAALRAGSASHEIHNIRVLEDRWPPGAASRAQLGPDPVADVALMAHVGYDIAAIGPFIDAMERASRRTCVAVLREQSPASVAAPFWPAVHGVERVPLPALEAFVELISARGAVVRVERVAGEHRRWVDRDELVRFLRRQLWTAPGSAADERLLAAVDRLAATRSDGGLTVPSAPDLEVGVVTWTPVAGEAPRGQ
ncbi:MAG: NTP transferase domain-containing protein [Candidatus Limnocylindrales bacterium]